VGFTSKPTAADLRRVCGVHDADGELVVGHLPRTFFPKIGMEEHTSRGLWTEPSTSNCPGGKVASGSESWTSSNSCSRRPSRAESELARRSNVVEAPQVEPEPARGYPAGANLPKEAYTKGRQGIETVGEVPKGTNVCIAFLCHAGCPWGAGCPKKHITFTPAKIQRLPKESHVIAARFGGWVNELKVPAKDADGFVAALRTDIDRRAGLGPESDSDGVPGLAEESLSDESSEEGGGGRGRPRRSAARPGASAGARRRAH